jgi:hypothetical protein
MASSIAVFQTVGGAFLLSAAQSAFVNVMVKVLRHSAPDIDPSLVIITGATELRDVFTPEQLTGVLIAYMRGIKIAFAIALAGTGMALVIGPFARWSKLNTAKITGGAA